MITFAPDIALLEYQDIRYQQDWETDFEGREYAATYLSARDNKTNTLLWVVKICDCILSASGSPGGRYGYVDISKIDLGPNENELTIETIVDSSYLVDLQTRTVTRLPDPEPVKKTRKIKQADPPDPPMPPPWSMPKPKPRKR